MRHLNAGVLVPLVLSFAIGVLIYLYVTSRSQHKTLLTEHKDLQRALSDLRSERDSLQYDLNTAKDENIRAVSEKEKALTEASDTRMKLERLEQSMSQLQADFDKLKDSDSDLQDNRDKAKADLTAFTNKWKQCEAARKEMADAATLRKSENDKELSDLRSQLAIVKQQKVDTERKFNEMEQSLQVCRRQSIQGGNHKPQPVPKVAVDDRSIELLPPKHAADVGAGAQVHEVGVAMGGVPVQGNDQPLNHNLQDVNANNI